MNLDDIKILLSENSEKVIALHCIDVPYSWIHYLIASVVPENITIKDGYFGEMDAALIVHMDGSECHPIIKKLIDHIDDIAITSERELIEKNPLFNVV